MLLIYLPEVTRRTEYVFDLVFKYELGIEYTVTTYRAKFESFGGKKINYSSNRLSDEGLFIQASPLLFKKTIEPIEIPVQETVRAPFLFPAECDMGFDIFSAIFYMVSRYEEYLPFTPDRHGRFKATDSLAHRYNFLQIPVVNIWIQLLKNKMQEKFTSLSFKEKLFKSIVTYDIDTAYEFKGKNKARSMGGIVKDIFKLNMAGIFRRLSSSPGTQDPWDVYDYLEETARHNKLVPIFFFLMADHSVYDKNLPFNHPEMISLVQKISRFSETGIHPSYYTIEKPDKILVEKERLEDILQKKVSKSRQHYLRFSLPSTFNELIAAGIKEDFSMGYADMHGFRAGTCTPFYFYDVAKERTTTLLIYPVACMDANFIYYSKSKPPESLEAMLHLLNEVKKVNGIFVSIWHNNTVSNQGMFKGWKRVHDELIKNMGVAG